jgi:uracil-DNA glycosylase
MQLPATWLPIVGAELEKPYYCELESLLASERQVHSIFPSDDAVFHALELTPFDQARVVILGQDPYHDVGRANGLAFSVQPGVKLPASLRNIFKELQDDLGFPISRNGCLECWANQGVLLLNTVLTVRAHVANSHRGKGWEAFTDAIIARLGNRTEPTIFVLWGKPAQTKKKLIDTERHAVIESAHPSPLSAHGGFFGSKPFSKINQALRAWGQPEIDWAIRDS